MNLFLIYLLIRGQIFIDTRQFTTVKACVPNSPNLINSIYLGEPVVNEHDGKGVTKSIIEEISKYKIKADQLEGASFDGAYFHQSVPKHMTDNLDLHEEFFATHDPLHKSGTHIRKDSNFLADKCSRNLFRNLSKIQLGQKL